MSICELNKRCLEAFVLGEAGLEDFDYTHSRCCPACREELNRALELHKMLREYVQTLDEEASALLAAGAVKRDAEVAWPESRFSWKVATPWVAAAASLLLAAFLGIQLLRAPEPQPIESAYLGSLENASARLEILAYLRRTQIFLLSLVDGSFSCEEGRWLQDEREVARKLVYTKHLLEPKLQDLSLQDVKPLLDEIELLLTDVANSQNCDALTLWQQVMESRSTLIKLNLLQMEGRI